MMQQMLMAMGGAYTYTTTISTDTTNFDLKTAAQAAGWDQVSTLNATVTIDSGIVVSANSTSLFGFDSGTSLPAGSTLAIINNGYIVGMGGAGGNGSSGAGQPGGAALRVTIPTTFTNTSGTVAGGGGGGNAGAQQDMGAPMSAGGGGGSGGRTGRTNSAGGSRGTSYDGLGQPTGAYGGNSGNPGTFTAAGTAAGNFGGAGISGAAGGNWGAASGGLGGLCTHTGSKAFINGGAGITTGTTFGTQA